MTDRTTSFTVKSIAKLPVPESGRTYWHDSQQAALALCITSQGTKTFYCIRRIDGRPTRYKIGRFPEWSVEQARKKTAKLLGEIAAGKNPQAERRAAHHEHTLGGLFDHWLQAHAMPFKKSWKEDQRQFDKFLKPWKTRRLSSITKSDLQSLHADIGRRSGPYQANRVLALLRAMLNQASGIGYQGSNPAAGIKKFAEQSRDRFLQPDELPKLFAALKAEPQIFQDFFVVALLAGARRSNVQAMKWADLHLDAAAWRIAESESKSGEVMLVHLPDRAVKILRRRQVEANGSEFVFPSRSKSGHLVEPKSAWKRITDAAGLEGLRIHDLRRSLASWQAIAGSSLTVIGRSLGHRSTQSTSVYARLTHAPVVASVNQAASAILEAAEPKKKRNRREAATNGKA